HDGARIAPLAGQRWLASGAQAVELHPLFHFQPGLLTFCLGAAGCSARCTFCQNWELALAVRQHGLPPGGAPAVDELLGQATARGCGAISFTYSEATVWPEGIEAVAARARAMGLRVILVTNGFIAPPTLAGLLPLIDAVKIDLKGASESQCQSLAGISLGPVIESLRRLRAAGVWLELSTVLVPGILDSRAAVEGCAELIREHCGTDTPWHLQRFFPAHRLVHEQPGDLGRLLEARRWALDAGLNYVYVSNISGIAERNTHCAGCGRLLIDRRRTPSGRVLSTCPDCHASLPGRWDAAQTQGGD
ncbi:MAG TPA: radical SAM protein, partial [Herpetosiphonaceae bacterium]|nr:radical SAM protein [Herpetosiphonaceae bacterium]